MHGMTDGHKVATGHDSQEAGEGEIMSENVEGEGGLHAATETKALYRCRVLHSCEISELYFHQPT